MVSKSFGLLMLGVLVGCASTREESGRESAEAASTCSAAEAVATGIGTKDISRNGRTLNGARLNGVQFNGKAFNGPILQGIRLNGWSLNGWSLNGVQLNGARLNGIQLNGPIIQGVTLNGEALAGARIDGAELEGELADGSVVPIFIDHVVANPNAKNAEVPLYQVSFGSSHDALCGTDENGAPRLASALAGSWDEQTGARSERSDLFTFACAGAALYKCVDSGYKPWLSAADADRHQACTRMIRADYCGNGTSFTKDGTLIDMNDDANIQKFETTSRPDFAFEAAWGPEGATCISKTRYPLTAIPQCVRDRMADACDGTVGLTNRSATNNACLR